MNLGTGLVQGKANGSFGFLSTSVELYRSALDPSGFGEGKTFVGSAPTSPAGDWALTDPAPDGGCYTAYTTDSNSFSGTRGSSEFSRSNCALFLPLIRR